MYLIVIAWIYVVLMMSVAEATNSNGTVLGALVTFVLYGAGPVALVVYLMGAPARSRAIKQRDALALTALAAKKGSGESAASPPVPSVEPDTGSHATGGAEAVSTATGSAGIAPVRKEP